MSDPCAACDYTDNGWCPCECHVAAPEPHRTSYVDSEGEERCETCDKWLEPGYYDIGDHHRAMQP